MPGRVDPIRLAGQFDASLDSTGVSPLTITATAVYGDHIVGFERWERTCGLSQ